MPCLAIGQNHVHESGRCVRIMRLQEGSLFRKMNRTAAEVCSRVFRAAGFQVRPVSCFGEVKSIDLVSERSGQQPKLSPHIGYKQIAGLSSYYQ